MPLYSRCMAISRMEGNFKRVRWNASETSTRKRKRLVSAERNGTKGLVKVRAAELKTPGEVNLTRYFFAKLQNCKIDLLSLSDLIDREFGRQKEWRANTH
jgi:hypothetical protein